MDLTKNQWSTINLSGMDDFIEKNTMLVTENNLLTMLLDTKHSFGHGYCLAAALLDINLKI